MVAAVALLVALGLDNAALGAGILPGGPAGRGAALRLGLGALALALAGAGAGRLARSLLAGWAPLMGAVLLFTLWVDGLRLFAAHQPRWVAADSPLEGPGWRAALAAGAANLDELGVGFAFGSLGVGGLWLWGAACAAETALALCLGLGLAGRGAEGRRLALWAALALFAGCALTLFGPSALRPPDGVLGAGLLPPVTP